MVNIISHGVTTSKKRARNCVFLYLDQLRRDGVGILLIERLLKSQGVEVHVVSSSDFIPKYLIYRPKLVMMGNVDIYHGLYARFVSKRSIICSLPTEQRLTSLKANINRFLIGHAEVGSWPEPYWYGVSHIYINGGLIYNELKKIDVFRDKIIKTGYPSIYNSKAEGGASESRRKFTVGISLEPTFNYRNMAKFIYESGYIELSVYGGLLGYINFHIKYLKSILDIIHGIASRNPDLLFIVRPRFPDNVDDFHFLEHEYSNLSVDDSLFAAKFFSKIDCLLVGMSNLGIEAQICGVPVVSIMGIMGDDIVKDRVDNYWLPGSYDELLVLLGQLERKELNISPNTTSFNDFVSNYYGDNVLNANDDVPVKVIANHLIHVLTHEKLPVDSLDWNVNYSEYAEIIPSVKSRKFIVFILKHFPFTTSFFMRCLLFLLKVLSKSKNSEYGRQYYAYKKHAELEMRNLLNDK